MQIDAIDITHAFGGDPDSLGVVVGHHVVEDLDVGDERIPVGAAAIDVDAAVGEAVHVIAADLGVAYAFFERDSLVATGAGGVAISQFVRHDVRVHYAAADRDHFAVHEVREPDQVADDEDVADTIEVTGIDSGQNTPHAHAREVGIERVVVRNHDVANIGADDLHGVVLNVAEREAVDDEIGCTDCSDAPAFDDCVALVAGISGECHTAGTGFDPAIVVGAGLHENDVARRCGFGRMHDRLPRARCRSGIVV